MAVCRILWSTEPGEKRPLITTLLFSTTRTGSLALPVTVHSVQIGFRDLHPS